jgi:hypothetical protein
MKWLSFLLILAASLFLMCSEKSIAITPDEYAQQVIDKDLPRSLGWLEKLNAVTTAEVPELPSLYREALPAPQPNWHSGISIKGSIERVLLLVDGSQLFSVVQGAPSNFQLARRRVQNVLQAAKDQTDQFKFGEAPAVLFQQWQKRGFDFSSFSREIGLVMSEIHRLLADAMLNKAETEQVNTGEVVATNSRPVTEDEAANQAPEKVKAPLNEDQAATDEVPEVGPLMASTHSEASTEAQNPLSEFDQQRFFAYVEASETGRIAPECVNARTWSTDQASRCESDDKPGCDRIYARQCKKLH